MIVETKLNDKDSKATREFFFLASKTNADQLQYRWLHKMGNRPILSNCMSQKPRTKLNHTTYIHKSDGRIYTQSQLILPDRA